MQLKKLTEKEIRREEREKLRTEYNKIIDIKLKSMKRFAGGKSILIELKQRFNSIT